MLYHAEELGINGTYKKNNHKFLKSNMKKEKKMEINTHTRCSVAWYNMLPMASVIFDT
jgi:hypothetical protein